MNDVDIEGLRVADEATIEKALEGAPHPALLPALAQLTGDLSVLRDDLRPDPNMLLDPRGGVTADQQQRAEAVALDAIRRWRRDGCEPAAPPDEAAQRRMLDFMMGGALTDDYFPLLVEELAVIDPDPRRPRWHAGDFGDGEPFTVAIIGAGMSGLAAAHRLDQVGVPFVVLEKNDDVGGTWFENRYPGCRVDVPNHLYSYSFAQRTDWPQHYSTQDVLLDYFRTCADDLGLRDRIRFGAEVEEARFDEERGVWVLSVCTAAGTETVEANAVVSAVGQLNRPMLPAIPGRDRFEGPAFHSAEWRDDVDLVGRRVAVIGTGASAVQLIPEIAHDAGELLVFQRTPPWLVPTPNYHEEVDESLRWLFRHVPYFHAWYRTWLFWRSHEGVLPAAVVDPGWEHQDRSVSAANDLVREFLSSYLREQFPDPEMLEAVLPSYPPVAKRVIRDNGIWARTLQRDDVRLVTTPITEICPEGVVTEDGEVHDVDVIIYGTGFQASRFLTPMRVIGRDGADLHDQWADGARAYLGITVPRFPNLFLLYGPNTNIVINGSIIYFSECEVHYLLESLRMLLERRCRVMDCKREVHEAYNARIDEGNRRMAWGASSVNSWYKDERGHVAQNWPFSLLEYWQQTRHPDPDDYVLG